MISKKIELYSLVFIIIAATTYHSFAIPTPQAINGVITELDGITPVPDGIDFSIDNLDTGYNVAGKTGRWGPGKYVASISGDDGDQILVKVWNEYNSANRTTTLSGVVYNFNIPLNMSFPQEEIQIASLYNSDPADEIVVENIEGESDVSLITVSTSSGQDILDVNVLGARPSSVSSLEKRVYSYLEIEQVSGSEQDSFSIEFTVDLEWLKNNGIGFEDIVLSRFTNSGWVDLETIFIYNDSLLAYYEAKTPGFSYFAITVREGVKTLLSPPVSSKVDLPFQISGRLFFQNVLADVPRGTKILFKNRLDGTETATMTGLGPDPGSFTVLIHGNAGDVIDMSVPEFEKSLAFDLEDIRDLELELNYHGANLRGITGTFLVDSIGAPSFVSAVLAFSIIMIVSVFLFSRNKKK